MSVIAFNELADGRRGPKIGPEGTRTYTRVFEAITDNPADTGPFVVSFAQAPVKYGPHPDDYFARCTDVDPLQDPDAATYWRLTYSYSTRPRLLAQVRPDGKPEESPKVDEDNPLNEHPEIDWETKYFKVPMEADLEGKPYVNAAGVPFETYLEERPRLVMNVSRNLVEFNQQLIVECEGALNDQLFLGQGTKKIKCERIRAKAGWKKNQGFVKVSAQVIICGPDEDWVLRKLNAGYEYWDAASGKLKKIYVDGQLPSRPQLLSEDGTKVLYIRKGDKPNYIEFRNLRSADLNQLGLFDGF